jgi:hypothetical protein
MLYRFISSRKFEIFITMIIISNTIILALDSHDTSLTLSKSLEVLNYIFNSLYLTESILKIFVVGF